jgi:hypothetical protein
MMTLILVLGTTCAIVAAPGHAQTDWETSGPEGGWMTSIGFDPVTTGTMYAGLFNAGTLVKSTHGGTTWTQLTTGLPGSSNISQIGFDPSTPATVYVATYGGDLYKSTDSGASWTSTATGLTNPRQIVVDPADGTIVYVVRYAAASMRSTDGGATFTALGTTSCDGATSLIIDPSVADRLYLGVSGCQHGGTGVFRSDDGGTTWTDLTTLGSPTFVTGLALDLRAPAVMSALTEGGVFTRDFGQVPVTLMSLTIE